MTTRTITGTYSSGYTLSAAYYGLDIASTAKIGGAGVFLARIGSVVNYGSVAATGHSVGVEMADGGTLINNSMISGYVGVLLTTVGSPASILLTNNAGGTIRGAYADVQFENYGQFSNYGTVTCGEYGVILDLGGAVRNSGVIEAAPSIFDGAGVVSPNGIVHVYNGGPGDRSATIEGIENAIRASGGGYVTNFGRLIGGTYGVVDIGEGTIDNSGAIVDSSAGNYADGVNVGNGGAVVNGSARNATALIESGEDAIVGNGPTTVTNYATVSSSRADGVDAAGGGAVTNGSTKDQAALITGASGIVSDAGAVTVKNFGTISASGGYGVFLLGGGGLTNGSASDHSATVTGNNGVRLAGGASTVNFGTIRGTGGFGAVLGLSAGLTNGSAGDSGALIAGGVYAYGGDTVVNFGTIDGNGGYAVEFQSYYATLKVEVGSTFVGEVYGDGSILDLVSGVGTISGLSADGDLTVSGSMSPTAFTDFDTLEIGAGAQFSDGDAISLAIGQAVKDMGILTLGGGGAKTVSNTGLIEVSAGGSLTLAGALSNTGTIEVHGGTMTVSRAVSGSGVAVIAGGTLDMGSTFADNVTFMNGGGVLELAKSRTYGGTVTGFSKNGSTAFDLLDIGFVSSTEATYSGSKTDGVLTVTDGTHAAHISLTGNYLNSTFVASSDGQGGVTVVDGAAMAPRTAAFVAAMASLTPLAGEARSPPASREKDWAPTLFVPRAHVLGTGSHAALS